MEEIERINLGEQTRKRFSYLINEGTYSEMCRIHKFLEKHEYKITNLDKRYLISQLTSHIMDVKSERDINKFEVCREILNTLEDKLNDGREECS